MDAVKSSSLGPRTALMQLIRFSCKWAGWNEDDGEDIKERLRGLAAMTKEYGGADLRVSNCM